MRLTSKARRINPRAGADARQAGVILLDVVIAMAIFALVILLVLPSLPHSTSPSRLGAYAAEVAAILKSDRSRAARTGSEVGTRVDIAGRRIESGGGRQALTLPDDVTLDMIASDTCRSPSGQFAVVFAADGRSCGAVIVLAKGGRDWRIRINWLTGFIDVVAPNRI
jgi:general secretion pathway protein H